MGSEMCIRDRFLTGTTLRAQNVGIGTTTPGAKLMVVGNPGAPTLNILPDSTSGMNPTIRANDNGRVGIGTTSPGARLMVIGTDGAPTLNILHDGMNPTDPAIRVNDNGRVGIGTTSPGARFMVVGTDGCLLYTSPSPRDLSTSRMPSSA